MTFTEMTQDEVLAAQTAWSNAVVAQDLEGLLALYDFDCLLFKPTMASTIRTTREGARSYFVAGDPNFAEDKGFILTGYTNVEWQSARGPHLEAGGLAGQDMGHYLFTAPDGSVTKADYSFSYHKKDGRVLITLHHSSFNVAN